MQSLSSVLNQTSAAMPSENKPLWSLFQELELSKSQISRFGIHKAAFRQCIYAVLAYNAEGVYKMNCSTESAISTVNNQFSSHVWISINE